LSGRHTFSGRSLCKHRRSRKDPMHRC